MVQFVAKARTVDISFSVDFSARLRSKGLAEQECHGLSLWQWGALSCQGQSRKRAFPYFPCISVPSVIVQVRQHATAWMRFWRQWSSMWHFSTPLAIQRNMCRYAVSSCFIMFHLYSHIVSWLSDFMLENWPWVSWCRRCWETHHSAPTTNRPSSRDGRHLPRAVQLVYRIAMDCHWMQSLAMSCCLEDLDAWRPRVAFCSSAWEMFGTSGAKRPGFPRCGTFKVPDRHCSAGSSWGGALCHWAWQVPLGVSLLGSIFSISPSQFLQGHEFDRKRLGGTLVGTMRWESFVCCKWLLMKFTNIGNSQLLTKMQLFALGSCAWGNVVSSRHDASRRLGVELPWKEKDRSSYKLALGADSWTHLWTFQQKVSPPRKIVKWVLLRLVTVGFLLRQQR